MPPARKKLALFGDLTVETPGFDLDAPPPKPVLFRHPTVPLPLPVHNVKPFPKRDPATREKTRLPIRRVNGRPEKMHLEKEPPQPPQAASRAQPRSYEYRKEFLEAQVAWLRSAPSMVSDEQE